MSKSPFLSPKLKEYMIKHKVFYIFFKKLIILP